jgi:hypothetical protein
MNIRLLRLLLILLIPPASVASDNLEPYKPAKASYWLYGGGLGDPIPPKTNDKKIAFSIEGEAAQQIFDAIGPDKHDACTEESGTRFRARDKENLSCTRSKEGDHVCNFGFDLVTGKSIGGSIC